MLRLLLTERVYGRLEARAAGQIEAAGEATLLDIQLTREPKRWRAQLRKLIPPVRDTFIPHVEAWFVRFFQAADRFCERARHDLKLLELEATYLYDIEELDALIGGSGALAPPDKDAMSGDPTR